MKIQLKNLKKPKIFIPGIVVIVLIGGYLIFGRKQGQVFQFVEAKKETLTQEVSVTGTVKPAQTVDLAFEVSGKVARVLANVSDKVSQGQTILVLDNRDLSSQLDQAKASLDSEQALLDQARKGSTLEEIKLAETQVSNAKVALEDAQDNLDAATNEADSQLQEDYDNALAVMQKSVSIAKNSILVMSDIQFSYDTRWNAQDSATITQTKADAIDLLLGVKNAGRWATQSISQLNGGAFLEVQQAVSNPSHEAIDQALSDSLLALQKVRDALNSVPIISDMTSSDKTNLATEKSNINTEIVNLTAKQQAISVQKSTNESSIKTAKESVNSANSAFLVAQDQLAIKKAGSTQEEIKSQEAKVEGAGANVANIEAQLAKTFIFAPFSGVVTKQDGKVGEIAAAKENLVSLISESKFQVEANIPEADIAKVKIGNAAKITLDAFGPDTIFGANVILIDPAETVVEGVATYKTTFEFNEKDERLKPGMTANIDIITSEISNAISIPQRAIQNNNGKKTVRVLNNGKIEEREIKTGIRGSDGSVEIQEGLNEGDKVVVS